MTFSVSRTHLIRNKSCRTQLNLPLALSQMSLATGVPLHQRRWGAAWTGMWTAWTRPGPCKGPVQEKGSGAEIPLTLQQLPLWTCFLRPSLSDWIFMPGPPGKPGRFYYPQPTAEGLQGLIIWQGHPVNDRKWELMREKPTSVLFCRSIQKPTHLF